MPTEAQMGGLPLASLSGPAVMCLFGETWLVNDSCTTTTKGEEQGRRGNRMRVNIKDKGTNVAGNSAEK